MTQEQLLAQLHPVLRRKIRAIISDLAGHGWPAKVAWAYRSPADQVRAYEAGHSRVRWGFHCAHRADGTPCSLAADIVHSVSGWGAPKEFWRLLGRSAEAHECTWGGRWKSPYDPAHCQLVPNSDLKRAKAGWLPPEDYGD